MQEDDVRRFGLVQRGVLLCCAVVAVAWTRPAPAKEPEVATELRDALEVVRARFKVPAIGAAIVSARGVELAATGMRRAGGKTPVTTKDRWHLGSCTKAMTATLIARLVERGTLAWDDTLAKRFPKLAKTMHADYRPATLAWLLANRGGAPEHLDAGGLWVRLSQREGTHRAQRMQLVEGVLTRAPVTKPGTAYVYANAGFAIAGAVAEHVMDKPWEDLMREHVFTRLGMKHTGFGAPGKAGGDAQPCGHVERGGVLVPVEPGPDADNPPAIGPAGTVHATLGDWAKFVAVHLRGGRGEDPVFLKPETFARLHTPPRGQDYALGWMRVERAWGGRGVLTHSGSNTMWYCTVWIAPEKGFAVLVTCNAATSAAVEACDQAVGVLIQRAQKAR